MSIEKRVNPVVKDTQITLRVPELVKKAATRMAAAEGLSRAAFVEALIRNEAKRRGQPIGAQARQPRVTKRRNIPRAYGT